MREETIRVELAEAEATFNSLYSQGYKFSKSIVRKSGETESVFRKGMAEAKTTVIVSHA